MAKKKTIIAKRIKTHGAHMKAQIVREKWADIRKSFSGKAIEIPLKPILKKVIKEFGPMLPEAKLKPLFDVENNDNNANEDSIAFEERVNDVCTIHTTDENWAKRYFFNMDKPVGNKYSSLENHSVKIVKWDLNANTTHSFANYGVAGTTRGSRDRSRIRNLMLTLCEKFTLLYDKKFKEHDIVKIYCFASINDLECNIIYSCKTGIVRSQFIPEIGPFIGRNSNHFLVGPIYHKLEILIYVGPFYPEREITVWCNID